MVLSHCPKCHGSGFQEVGIGIQRVENDIQKLIPDQRLIRLDSDGKTEPTHIIKEKDNYDIILSTYASGLPLVHLEEVSMVVFLLFESELTLPDYRMEEDLYHTIAIAKKSGKSVVIQTYIPEHPLLEVITYGNYKDFLALISREREQFSYPPYTEFVTLRIHDESKDRLSDMVKKLVNKIQVLDMSDIFIAYDHEARERSRGEWVEKIIIRWKNIRPLLDALETELVRNRNVTLDWN
jgi:primosomal protein N' (replication factor Y) (superfamily II helicase)